MMIHPVSREVVWQRLVSAGAASGEMPPAAPAHGPWYIRAMLGAAGWLGALFLLGFVGVGLAFVFRDESAALAIGLMACVAAYAIFRAAGDNDFLSQFGLALSFAGQVLMLFGLSKWFRNDAVSLALLVAVIESALAVVLVNTVHRVWSSLAAATALSYALTQMGLSGVAPALVAAGLAAIWLHESLWVQRGALWRPIGMGLALSQVCLESLPVLERGGGLFVGRAHLHGAPSWVGPLLMGMVGVYTVHQLLLRNGVAASSRTGVLTLAAAVVIAVVTRDAPGVVSALMVLTLGHATGSRMLMGLGVIALLGWLSHYYYALQMTLLAKSGVLAATGMVLMVLWLIMRRLWPRTATETNHA